MEYSKIHPDLLFEISILESLPELRVSELICRVEVESESSSEQHRVLRNDCHRSEKWAFSSRFRFFLTFSICAVQSWKCRLRRWKFCPRWVGRDGTTRCPRRIFLNRSTYYADIQNTLPDPVLPMTPIFSPPSISNVTSFRASGRDGRYRSLKLWNWNHSSRKSLDLILDILEVDLPLGRPVLRHVDALLRLPITFWFNVLKIIIENGEFIAMS